MRLQHTLQAILLEFVFTMSHVNLKNNLSNYEARNQEATLILVPNELPVTNDYLSRCVTLAKATANACNALKGY